ncbi:Os11g0171601, partial [Oryza sativa Japonica Group]
TRLVEHGEAEISGLEGGVLGGAGEEEVLGLEVPVHDAERVASLDDGDDGADELRGGALGVVALGDDAVEELAAGAELHDDVDEQRVLVGAADADDVGVLGEVVHDLDLAPHVLVVLPAQQLPLGDGLARELAAARLVHAQVRRPELPLPELLPDAVVVAHVRRLVRQHRHRPTSRRRHRRRRQLRLRIGVAVAAAPARVRLH